ncbi:polysaccharide biosynthesis C-terminal domain-containing protein [Eubacteriales bacterium OttesenSCG-928-N13]|nr:polysaccharide biosynthesis C-terminal domain-containing protein [Eubacteriales bacterium OttesenSCG-928-N13]
MTRDRSYYRRLITLALPVAAQGLIAFLATFADNLMVSSLGDEAMSGVYFTGQMNTFVQMFASGIGGVILILSAQYWGKRETAPIKSIVSIGLKMSFAVGMVISCACLIFPAQILRLFNNDEAVLAQGVIYLRTVCVSYVFFCISQSLLSAMRAVENTMVGMVISLISLALNVSLNALFIYGMKWGVFGAALATLIGRVVEMVAIVFYVLRLDQKLAYRLSDLRRKSAELLRDYVRYGLPLIAGELVWSVNMMVNSVIFGQFFGSSVSTAVSIANMMGTMAFIAISGLASAVGIITGTTVGAGKTELMKEYARTTQVIFLFVGLFSGALVAGLNGPFVSLYAGVIGNISPEAAVEARRLIYVLAVTIVGSGYQMPCLFGLVKSGGDISFVFKNDTIFVFLVVLPSAIISAWMGAPAWVVFACLKSDQILKCFVAIVKVNKYNWMKNLTHTKEEIASAG